MPDETQPVDAPDPNPGQDFYYAVQPNRMSYVDGNGVSRQIHIPKGRNQEASQHFMNEDWEALARFPTWTGSEGQQYKAEDFEKIPKGSESAKS